MRIRSHRKWARAALFAVVGSSVAAATSRADVKLPAVLSEHMVLQQGLPVPVWGTADAGEDVTVTFGEQKQTAKAGPDGKWSVKLSPLTASDKPADLTVSGKNTVKLSDVLVGEVWVCSGQSNMEFTVNSAKNSKEEIAAADFPNVRLFTVPKAIKDEPQSDTTGKWAACGPQTVGGFSAVGYFFGRDLHKAMKAPVGLIHTSWGGTVAEAWMPRAALEAEADFKPILDRSQFNPADYEKQLESWKAAAEKAKAAGKPEPRKPQDEGHNPNRASVLYNGMIAPIVPFAARGATWYQGESNAGRAEQYRKLLPALIASWRKAWDEPECAFHIVSLANFQAPPKEPGESDWAELREAQWLTGEQPHNGVALAIDLADADKPEDIHPHNKQDVGHRLALVALAKTYGKADVAYTGPVYDSMKVEGDGVRIKFKFADGLHARGGEAVKGFQVAGEDKKWHWAEGRVDGDSVVLKLDTAAKPAAVRYDWAHNPQGNLYNKADLPAAPFRTDDWPGVTAGKK